MLDQQALLRRLYDRFNARDITGVLEALHADVQWANGWEGGYVSGHDAVRDYWRRQWATIDPHVEPVGFSRRPDGRITADIQQTVRDLSGKLLSEKRVGHVFRLGDDGLVRRFDIGEP